VDRLKDEVDRVRSLELEPLQRQLRGEARLHSDLELALTRVRNAEQELHSSRKLFEGRAKIVAHQAKELVSLREQLVSKFRDAKLLERPCPACPVAYCASDENHADLRRSRLSEALWGAEEMAEMREEVNVRKLTRPCIVRRSSVSMAARLSPSRRLPALTTVRLGICEYGRNSEYAQVSGCRSGGCSSMDSTNI
jgi:hypothetical protein